MIRLEPMDEATYAEWRELTVADYAREKIEAGNWPAEGALALAEIEAFARDHGLVGVELHVFGDNAGARRLYLEAGYIETNVKMLKRVTR